MECDRLQYPGNDGCSDCETIGNKHGKQVKSKYRLAELCGGNTENGAFYRNS